jgi:hypothetical protein
MVAVGSGLVGGYVSHRVDLTGNINAEGSIDDGSHFERTIFSDFRCCLNKAAIHGNPSPQSYSTGYHRPVHYFGIDRNKRAGKDRLSRLA